MPPPLMAASGFSSLHTGIKRRAAAYESQCTIPLVNARLPPTAAAHLLYIYHFALAAILMQFSGIEDITRSIENAR